MSIADKLNRLNGAREDIIDALDAKGVTAFGHGFEDFPDDIASITGGGGGAISIVDTVDVAGGTVRTITAISISSDTVTADDLAYGVTAHNAAGAAITGTIVDGDELEYGTVSS